VSVETEAFGFGAVGMYADGPAGPSLFLYGSLDRAIGGPAFFFVRGLSAGFGYNRRLNAPRIEEVAAFPLVAEALGTLPPTGLADEMRRLSASIVDSPGDYFLAAGVHFSSFQMIDSFVLLVAGWGHRFELDVLGLSTMVLPAADSGAAGTPVASVQVALRAAFAPDDGYLTVRAQLADGSYLLTEDCRLTGGLAFATWFGAEHHGDFVVTAGGYHPRFTVPAHYPVVPRLGFSWIRGNLSLKGGGYFALTPAALMAGGEFSAVYQDGSLRAWFDVSLSFLVGWQPYHYEANLRLAVGAAYTFSFFGTHTISVHVGTDVRFWGPDFGGTATVDLSIISFTVTFGTTVAGAKAVPVSWQRFRDTQLPEAARVVTVAVRRGARNPGAGGSDLGVIDPADFELVTDSVVPSTSGTAGKRALGSGRAFGISSMGIRSGITSTQTIKITRNGTAADQYFAFEPVTKNLPAAQWGGELTPTLTGPALIVGLLTGYLVRPVPAIEPTPVTVEAVEPKPLASTTFTWKPLPPFQQTTAPFNLGAGAAARSRIAGKLLPGAELDLGGLNAADFLETPRVA
jgi:hypothetical protein